MMKVPVLRGYTIDGRQNILDFDTQVLTLSNLDKKILYVNTGVLFSALLSQTRVIGIVWKDSSYPITNISVLCFKTTYIHKMHIFRIDMRILYNLKRYYCCNNYVDSKVCFCANA